MKRNYKAQLLIFSFLFLSFIQPEPKITIWMIGDSTMSIKETKAYPETGWGMPFVYFFDSSVTVTNLAKNGRSTKPLYRKNYGKRLPII